MKVVYRQGVREGLRGADKSDQVSVWVASSEKPTLWVCGGGRYVIMPMARN
jgi:hypothetical protein